MYENKEYQKPAIGIYDNIGDVIQTIVSKGMIYLNDKEKSFDVGEDGNVYQVWFDEIGVHITKWELTITK